MFILFVHADVLTVTHLQNVLIFIQQQYSPLLALSFLFQSGNLKDWRVFTRLAENISSFNDRSDKIESGVGWDRGSGLIWGDQHASLSFWYVCV